MRNKVAHLFKAKSEELKTCEKAKLGEVAEQLYILAEQVVINKGVGGFESIYKKLKDIIATNQPVVVDLSKGQNEHIAFSYWTNKTLNEGIVENLSTKQKVSLVDKADLYDDFVESFIFDNLDDLLIEQIQQLYLAQTIVFYYIFEDESVNDMEFIANHVIRHLLSDIKNT